MADTMIVATFGYRHEAEFARETLRSAGIESILIGDDAGGAYAGMSFTRPMVLRVRADELEHAREVLADFGTDGEDEGDVDGEDEGDVDSDAEVESPV